MSENFDFRLVPEGIVIGRGVGRIGVHEDELIFTELDRILAIEHHQIVIVTQLYDIHARTCHVELAGRLARKAAETQLRIIVCMEMSVIAKMRSDIVSVFFVASSDIIEYRSLFSVKEDLLIAYFEVCRTLADAFVDAVSDRKTAGKRTCRKEQHQADHCHGQNDCVDPAADLAEGKAVESAVVSILHIPDYAEQHSRDRPDDQEGRD